MWSPDGQSLYFTSDRAGGPQIYRIGVRPGDKPKRITFSGSYNARPRVCPDGTQLAMVTLDGSTYRIAVQNLTNSTRAGALEGPARRVAELCAERRQIIYTRRDGGRDVLATVIDRRADQRAAGRIAGEVREPVWGPSRSDARRRCWRADA